MLFVRHALVSFLAIAFVIAIPQTLLADAFSNCGPGPHWVDSCTGGTVRLSTITNAAMSLDLDQNGSLETYIPLVTLTGYTDVLVSAGTDLTTPHSLSTEVYNLMETVDTPFGTITLRAGDGTANGLNDGPLYSFGQVVEELFNSSLADHTVNIMFEVDIPLGVFGALPNPGMVLHNQDPLVATCIGLTQAPPTTCQYFLTTDPLKLFDAAGVLRGEMSTAIGPNGPIAHHVVTPEPVSVLLLSTCVCGLLTKLRRRS